MNALIRKKSKYFLLAVLFIFLLANRGFRNLARNYREYKRLDKCKAELKLDQETLRSRLKTVKDSAYIEQAARNGLGVIKPGEKVYLFPPPKEEDK